MTETRHGKKNYIIIVGVSHFQKFVGKFRVASNLPVAIGPSTPGDTNPISNSSKIKMRFGVLEEIQH